MIARAVYVKCDECGNPAEVIVGTAAEARRIARLDDHYVRVDGRDLCPDCTQAAPLSRSQSLQEER